MKTEHKWTLIILYQIMILVMLILETELYIPMYLLLFFQTGLLLWQTFELKRLSELTITLSSLENTMIHEQAKTIEQLRKELGWPTKNT